MRLTTFRHVARAWWRGIGVLLACAGTLLAPAASAQQNGLYEIKNPAAEARTLYPMVVSGGRGFLVLCLDEFGRDDQAAEQLVIRAMGYQTGPALRLEINDPIVTAASPSENPRLCPAHAKYPIRVFRHAKDGKIVHYLQFPTKYGSGVMLNRLYIAGCRELVDALGLSLAAAVDADPTVFFTDDQISRLECLGGTPISGAPESFAEWCTKPDLTAGQSRLVGLLLNRAGRSDAEVGDPLACSAAGTVLDGLSALSLDGECLDDLAPLAVLENLQKLSLRRNCLDNVSGLSGLGSLTYLDISENTIERLEPIAPLSRLLFLDASSNGITDIQGLASATSLTELRLASNGIRDLRPLRLLGSLTRLSLADNGLTGEDIAPLIAINALTWLDLSENLIRSLEGFRDLPATVNVILRGNPITGESALTFIDLCVAERGKATPRGRTMDALLEATGDPEATCSVAEGRLKSSAGLTLAGKNITDLFPLVLLPHLRELILAQNTIVDIGPLARLERLTTLDLTENLIEDVSPLAGLDRGVALKLAGNPIKVPDFESACVVRGQEESVLTEAEVAEFDALDSLTLPGRSCARAAADLATTQYALLADKGLTELKFIAALESAEDLNLTQNKIRDIRPLSGLALLERLSLDGNPLQDLFPLADLKLLRYVTLLDTGKNVIDDLAELPVLSDAYFSGETAEAASFAGHCLIQRFDPDSIANTNGPLMRDLNDLMQRDLVNPQDCAAARDWAETRTRLNLRDSGIRGIEPLSNFRSLRDLTLSLNSIEDVLALQWLDALERVNLNDNDISGGLVRFRNPGLKHLALDRTFVTFHADLAPPNIEVLSLKENGIEDIPEDFTAPYLRELDLRDNKIGSRDDQVIALAARGVIRLKGNPVCSNVLSITNDEKRRAMARACEIEGGSVTWFVDELLHRSDLRECLEDPNCPLLRPDVEFRPPLGVGGPIIGPTLIFE